MWTLTSIFLLTAPRNIMEIFVCMKTDTSSVVWYYQRSFLRFTWWSWSKFSHRNDTSNSCQPMVGSHTQALKRTHALTTHAHTYIYTGEVSSNFNLLNLITMLRSALDYSSRHLPRVRRSGIELGIMQFLTNILTHSQSWVYIYCKCPLL